MCLDGSVHIEFNCHLEVFKTIILWLDIERKRHYVISKAQKQGGRAQIQYKWSKHLCLEIWLQFHICCKATKYITYPKEETCSQVNKTVIIFLMYQTPRNATDDSPKNIWIA